MSNITISKVVPQKVKGLQETVQSLKIKTQDDYEKATELVSGVKKLQKFIKQEMDKTIKPAQEIIKATKEKYNPYLDEVKKAETEIKDKMTAFFIEQRKKEEEKKKKLAERVERGTMKAETAVRKIEEMPETKKTVKTENGGATVRMIKEVVIEDETKLPREYLVPDKTKIRRSALAGVEIPGVKVVEKPSIAIK